MRAIGQQTILITGATGGLGRRLALDLGTAGALVLVHGRDAGRAEQVRKEVEAVGGRAETVVADLASLRAVDALAEEVLSRFDRLDVLVNNAAAGGGAPGGGREVSADGYELRFAVNHLAARHLSRRLLPLLRASAPARIVDVASAGQAPVDFDDPQLERHYDGIAAYCQSKLAMIASGFALAEEVRGSGVSVTSLHPATFMATTMVRESGITPTSTVEEGARAALRLIRDPSGGGVADEVSGRYFNGTAEARAQAWAYDAEARSRLVELSDGLIAQALATG
ncbi:3-oxoacyl-ACP reductase [Mangrovactinospora gilvigrisea]|uniref:3-oxoacyl-ACP reductase n=1 Tax=Mangrovactinospora gilvigrisea TaxID=1428644 RepID=A0A1J7BAH5_9ACTN|nr:SDR family NAD(P)-dependent oxidoreductase [Mangrovactinospora gilvigrisea]OIV35695.1 3-oxoacyl-ACP reductase [Mangrovactinospora gilvigrisea]